MWRIWILIIILKLSWKQSKMRSEECWFKLVLKSRYVHNENVCLTHIRAVRRHNRYLVFDITNYNLFGNSTKLHPNRHYKASYQTMSWNFECSTYHDHLWRRNQVRSAHALSLDPSEEFEFTEYLVLAALYHQHFMKCYQSRFYCSLLA